MKPPSDLEDREALTVYSDWLLEQGHPQGELIAAQLAGNTARVADLLEDEADALLGELGGEAGFRAKWQNGFIVEANLGIDQPCWMEQGFAVRALLHLRTAELLQALDLGDFEDVDEDYEDVDTFEDFERALEILARVKIPPTLRRLAFRPSRMPIENVRIGDLGPALQNMPLLQDLYLVGDEIAFGAATMPNVTRLTIRTSEPSRELVDALIDPDRLQALEMIDLREFHGDDAEIAQLRARFGSRMTR